MGSNNGMLWQKIKIGEYYCGTNGTRSSERVLKLFPILLSNTITESI